MRINRERKREEEKRNRGQLARLSVRQRCTRTCGSNRLEKLRVPVQLINDVSGQVVVGGACLCDSATAPPLLDIATASYRPKGLL